MLSLSLIRHTTKTWWSGGKDPRILDLGSRRRWVVSFTPRPLYPREMNTLVIIYCPCIC